MRDHAKAITVRVALKDLANDLRFGFVDAVFNAYSAFALFDLKVFVAVHGTAHDEPATSFRQQMLVRSLRGLLAFQLRREAPSGDHELVNGPVERDLFVGVEVEEADPTFEEILDDEARAECVTAQTRLVTDDDGVELLVLGGVE